MSEQFPAKGYRDNVLADCFADAKRYFLDHYLDVDRAHALMLAERKIITDEELAQILAAIESLDIDSIRAAEYDGSVEDLFFFLQREIAAACDARDAADRLHTARSRNDIDVTIYRLHLRGLTLELADAAVELQRVLLDLAGQHHESLMPAYTHTQPAQPTTLAHYLLAMAENTGRDVRRLRRAYGNMNRCPLGACAITTTGFPIDRQRVADLLGFDGPTGNSYASIASTDYFTELLGAVVTMLINVGRFAQEFLLMAMAEFGTIRLPDGFVQSSSIMPQKRNPVAIEHVRAIASKALGQALGVMTAIHNTPFGDINDVEDDLQPLNFSALADAKRAVSLLAGSLESTKFDLDLLRERASSNFITVTELADALVRTDGLPFRTAHEIVAACVARAEEGTIDYETLQAEFERLAGRVTSMTEPQFADALSAEHFVAIRDVTGGPAPDTTRAALAGLQEAQHEDAAWLETARGRLEAARQLRAQAVQAALSK